MQDPVSEEPRSDEQLSKGARRREAGDGVEDVGDVRCALFVGGEQPEILVDRRVCSVVVARADVNVAAHGASLTTSQQRELRVDLQVRYPEDDVDAGTLERTRPFDVPAL